MKPTINGFLLAYAEELYARYAWARDETKFKRFIESAYLTLTGEANSWNRDGEAANAACKAIGLPAGTSLKALRKLPIGESADEMAARFGIERNSKP